MDISSFPRALPLTGFLTDNQPRILPLNTPENSYQAGDALPRVKEDGRGIVLMVK
jgi:hypothetical protein